MILRSMTEERSLFVGAFLSVKLMLYCLAILARGGLIDRIKIVANYKSIVVFAVDAHTRLIDLVPRAL